MAKLSEILKERGYVYQYSSAKLEDITDGPQRTLYLGIDPSADSLQVGQLQAFLILRRFLEAGHKVILLVGGGTGMIGDPGGKNEERPLLDAQTVKSNGQAIAEQAKRLFGSGDFMLANNADWLLKLNLIEFLRDTGKHFTVNEMMKREMIRERIENPDQSISFTEFSYMLLQSYDFFHLHTEERCDLQVGGSDQWGNIVSGVDFVRRKTGDHVYAFTWPLLVNKSTGKKFGKSEQGTVWLDPGKTTVYQFYQFWFNTEDEVVQEYLLKMTMLSMEEVSAIMLRHVDNPGTREAQKALAEAVTELVHGKEAVTSARAISELLFGERSLNDLSSDTVAMLKKEAPGSDVKLGMSIIDVLVISGLASSKREARQFVSEKAVTVNGNVVDENSSLDESQLKGGMALLKRGKRNIRVLRFD